MNGFKFYTYYHTRNDTGEIFYVGKGTGRRAFAKYRNAYWQNIVAKHGRTAHIIAYWRTEQYSFEHEKELIQELRATGFNLTNMTDGGEGSIGAVRNAEFRAKVSAFHKGRKHTPEHIEANRRANTGLKRSEDTRRRVSDAKRGSIITPEQANKISSALKGRTFSAAHRAALSEAAKGRKGTRLGVVLSDDTKLKMAIASTGKKHSVSTREKMSASQKLRYQRESADKYNVAEVRM